MKTNFVGSFFYDTLDRNKTIPTTTTTTTEITTEWYNNNNTVLQSI